MGGRLIQRKKSFFLIPYFKINFSQFVAFAILLLHILYRIWLQNTFFALVSTCFESTLRSKVSPRCLRRHLNANPITAGTEVEVPHPHAITSKVE
jgi:hypothetical protein